MAIATFPEISSRSKPFLGMAKLCLELVGLPAVTGGAMSTNPTRAVAATRTLEFDHPSAVWSLADDIADRIAAACHPAELHDIHRDMYKLFSLNGR